MNIVIIQREGSDRTKILLTTLQFKIFKSNNKTSCHNKEK